MNLKLKSQKNNNIIQYYLVGICIICYGISLVFAKESKKELGVLLAISLVLVVVMNLVSKDKKVDGFVKKCNLELSIYIVYFCIFIIWISFNSIFNIIPADYINIILLLFIPYIISKAFRYDSNSLGFNIGKFIYGLPKTLLCCIVMGVFLVPTVFLENIKSNNSSILTGIITFLIVFALVFVLTALPEEFFFRTLLQTRLEDKLNNSTSGIIISSVIFAFLSYVITRLILRKLGYNIKQMPKLTNMYVDIRFVTILAIIMLIGIVLTRQKITVGEYIVTSSELMLVYAFLFDGIALVVYYINNKLKLSKGVIVAIVILTTFSQLGIMYIILGIVDIIADFRRLDPNRNWKTS